ncbi:MAG: response regulator [Lachnospiraceae bacterium]|nr:response regulator [Lachnospiraceae bacterium]
MIPIDGRILIICESPSFLAKALSEKLSELDLTTTTEPANPLRLRDTVLGYNLYILFPNALSSLMQTCVDIVQNAALRHNHKIIAVGEPDILAQLEQKIPGELILGLYARPLDMDTVLSNITQYNRFPGMFENDYTKRILVIDDDVSYLRTVREWLKDDYRIQMASGAVQAIRYLTSNGADLILLDYEMPVTNGSQVIEMLRQDPELCSIPIMVLTGHQDKSVVMEVVNLRPVDYLLKSIGKDELLNKINRFFAGR